MGVLRSIVVTLVSALVLSTAHAQIRAERIDRVRVQMETSVDRFNGFTLITPRKWLDLKGPPMLVWASFNPSIARTENGAPQAVAIVRYRGQGWIHMAETIDLLVDGRRLQLLGARVDNASDVTTCAGPGACIVEEYGRFPLPHDVLEALANARQVEVRINGARGRVEGFFTEQHVAYIREVLRQLPGEASLEPPQSPADPAS